MTELSTGRKFNRTVINVQSYRATTPAQPPTHDPFYDNPLQVDEFAFVRDQPGSRFYLAKILEVSDTFISVHYFGCRTPNIMHAMFRPCFIHPPTDTITIARTPPPNQLPYTGQILQDDLSDLLVVRNVELTASLRLTRPSQQKIFSIRDQLFVFD